MPTLVIDGTVMMGSEDFHAFMRYGADELAQVLPNAGGARWRGRTTARLPTCSPLR